MKQVQHRKCSFEAFPLIQGMFLGLLLIQSLRIEAQLPDSLYTAINKPNMVSAHPLGILLYRINHRFSNGPVHKTTFFADLGSANIWLPEVRGYLPHDPQAVEYLQHFPWHQRDSVFQGMPRNYDSMVFRADGVIKNLQLQVALRINRKIEVQVGMRSFLLTGGGDPSTWLTGDGFIEGFHENIAGGTDPFARNQYGLNQAGIYYQGADGNAIRFENRNFVLAGLTTDLLFYPEWVWLHQHRIRLNTGLHLGLNTTAYNRGIDAGLSMSVLKQFPAGKANTLSIAAAGSVMRQRLIDLNATANFVDSKYLPAFEAVFSYRKSLKGERFWELGLDFYYLGPYKPAADFDRITPVGNRLSSHWHMALSHLYRNSQNWSVFAAFGRKWKWMLYINEDFKVNNAPDIQTGIGVAIPR